MYGGLDSNGGSWLGKKVIQRSDGTFLFDNIWGDTVTIKTQASIGDSWTFFRDSTYFSYKASMVAIDTMTILGVLDTVKKITIEADTNGVVNLADPVNNFQIILSQHYGFVQVFDLMTFPFHEKDRISTFGYSYTPNFDYYYDLITNNVSPMNDGTMVVPPDTITAIFKLIPFSIPTTMEIYDYNIGDVFESDLGSYAYDDITVDSVVSKTLTPFSVTYTAATASEKNWFSPFPTMVTFSAGTTEQFADTTKLFYLDKLPEEWRSPKYYHYFPNAHIIGATDSCATKVYQMDNEHIDYEGDALIYYYDWDAGFSFISANSASYGIGYGEVAMDTTRYYGEPSTTVQNMQMYYANKSGNSCGTEYHIPLSVDNVQGNNNRLSIYPNPASSELVVSSSEQIYYIAITNIVGQKILSGSYTGNRVQLNVSSFLPGIYYIMVNNSEVRKWVKD